MIFAKGLWSSKVACGCAEEARTCTPRHVREPPAIQSTNILYYNWAGWLITGTNSGIKYQKCIMNHIGTEHIQFRSQPSTSNVLEISCSVLSWARIYKGCLPARRTAHLVFSCYFLLRVSLFKTSTDTGTGTGTDTPGTGMGTGTGTSAGSSTSTFRDSEATSQRVTHSNRAVGMCPFKFEINCRRRMFLNFVLSVFKTRVRVRVRILRVRILQVRILLRVWVLQVQALAHFETAKLHLNE